MLQTHCCQDVSWAAQTGKHLLRTQNVSEQNQKHFLCRGHPDTKFVSATNVARLGKRGNIFVGNKVSSFSRALSYMLCRSFHTSYHYYQHEHHLISAASVTLGHATLGHGSYLDPIALNYMICRSCHTSYHYYRHEHHLVSPASVTLGHATLGHGSYLDPIALNYIICRSCHTSYHYYQHEHHLVSPASVTLGHATLGHGG